MDNQQATPETDLAWLAGIIDGEGHLGVGWSRPKGGKEGAGRFTVRFSISNTGASVIDKTARILDDLKITFGIMERKAPTPNYDVLWELRIYKMAHIDQLIPKLLPYLTVKKARASLLHRFVNSRIRRGVRQGTRHPYSIEELECMVAICEDTVKGESSEAMSQARRRLAEAART